MRVFGTIVLCFALSCCSQAFLPGYELTALDETPWGYSGTLSLLSAGPYGYDITPLAFYANFQTSARLHVKIYDPNNARWEVPDVVQVEDAVTAVQDPQYSLTFTKNPFGFAVVRESSGEILFNSTPSTSNPMFNGLIFEDQYIEFSTTLPENPNIYGLGERVYSLRLSPNNVSYGIWNRDQGTPVNENLYGTHPFYLDLRLPSGNAHGVFLLSSNAQSVFLTPNSLTWRTIGGVIDLYFFLGPTPNEVVAQYHAVIGHTFLPPYWALGYHQCRWGYHTIEETATTVENFLINGLPIDTIWNDIDYMDMYRDFTSDPERFPTYEYKAFTDWVHSLDMHYIIIIDPGLAYNESYPPFSELYSRKLYIAESNGQYPVIGAVWPGLTAFPDFSNPQTADFWFKQIAAFHSIGPEFDGLWIDMNEISSFCPGECPHNDTPPHVMLQSEMAHYAGAVGKQQFMEKLAGVYSSQNTLPADPYDNPPYNPVNAPLNTTTLSMNALLTFGINYNVHSLYGFLEGRATVAALEKLRGKRAVVISRSTFAGSGFRHGHWLGDNTSDWPDLYYSIPGMLAMNMFGIALVGADICGFGGDTTPELCARWMQLGSFYPFCRNHNAIGSVGQEPYALGPIVLNASRAALWQRYLLLPYYYSLFYEAHVAGGTVVRPLFFEFADDPNTTAIDRQFLVGPALLVSPVLDEGNTTVWAYFPPGAIWYAFDSGAAVANRWQLLEAPMDVINVHIRGGFIVPTQAPATRTAAARLNPFTLVVALGAAEQPSGVVATGLVYLDDGESLNTTENRKYTLVTYNVTQNRKGSGTLMLVATVMNAGYVPPPTAVLGTVKIYGVTKPPSVVTVNSQVYSSVSYLWATQTLVITDLQLSMTDDWIMTW